MTLSFLDAENYFRYMTRIPYGLSVNHGGKEYKRAKKINLDNKPFLVCMYATNPNNQIRRSDYFVPNLKSLESFNIDAFLERRQTLSESCQIENPFNLVEYVGLVGRDNDILKIVVEIREVPQVIQ